MRFKTSKGRFTKFDRRKFIFDEKGNVVWVPRVGFVNEKFEQDLETEGFLKGGKKVIPRRFVRSLKLTGRGKDQDLYTYFNRTKINQTVDEIKKEYKNHVVVARVEVKFKKTGRHIITQEFKVSDFKANFLHSSKGRLGKKYKASDAMAYYVHTDLSEGHEITMYEFRTDIAIQVKRGNLKRNKKSVGTYHGKNQEFITTFKVVPKRTAKSISHVTGEVKKKDKPKKRRKRIKKSK